MGVRNAHESRASRTQQNNGEVIERPHGGKGVTQARARAQRAKLDAYAQSSEQEDQGYDQGEVEERPRERSGKSRKNVTLERAIQDYLDDHTGGNHSDKTLEWHETALGLMRGFLEQGRGITLVVDVDAPDISAWFTSMRKTPGSRGKIRSERTIQTYARSARAFFHWLVRQRLLIDNPFGYCQLKENYRDYRREKW